jgi:hypothetical protein
LEWNLKNGKEWSREEGEMAGKKLGGRGRPDIKGEGNKWVIKGRKVKQLGMKEKGVKIEKIKDLGI